MSKFEKNVKKMSKVKILTYLFIQCILKTEQSSLSIPQDYENCK